MAYIGTFKKIKDLKFYSKVSLYCWFTLTNVVHLLSCLSDGAPHMCNYFSNHPKYLKLSLLFYLDTVIELLPSLLL